MELKKYFGLIQNIIDSFKNTNGGFSGKKISVMVTYVTMSIVCIQHTNSENLVGVITALSANGCTLMGINVLDKFHNPTKPIENNENITN